MSGDLRPWYTLALVPRFPSGVMLDFGLDAPIDLGLGVKLTLLPEWIANITLRDEYFASSKLWPHLRHFTGDPEIVLAVEYQAPALSSTAVPPEERTAVGSVFLANLAAWLTCPSALCFGFVISAYEDGGRWILGNVAQHDPLLPHEKDRASRISRQDLQAARELTDQFFALTQGAALAPITVAAAALWQALTAKNQAIRYVLLWIALEALFGPEEPNEVTFRLSQNVALFLADGVTERGSRFKVVKRDYRLRSKIVHGEWKALGSEFTSIIHRAEGWVRSAMVRILKDPELVAAFSTSKGRDAYFEKVVFSTQVRS